MICQNNRLHYCFSGNLNKPLILFLHGFMGNSDEFDAVVKSLANEFYCLSVDLPGHGKTQVLDDDCYTMAKTADALISFLDNLLDSVLNKSKISRCFLIGYSMGGRLALYLMLHFPQYFHKVILESASPGLSTQKEKLERVKRDEQIARKLARMTTKDDFIIFLDNWYNQPIFGNIKNHPQFERMIKNRLQNNPEDLAKSLRLMGTGVQPSLWNYLQENKVPLLLLVGEHDKKFVDINKRMLDINEFCELNLHIVKNTAHNIHLENAPVFVKNIRDFFN